MRIYALRIFGWQLDYRPDGWLPLGVREGWCRWWICRLGKFGCVTLGPIADAHP
jgi:hypothetical protein